MQIVDFRFAIASGLRGLLLLNSLKSARSSRAAWVGVLVCGLILQFAHSAPAQKSDWDPGLPKDVFSTGNPPERLRPAKCKECADKMAALQAALDDWYAMRLAEIDKILSGSDKPPKSTQDRLEKERGDLLKGLGNPKDGGAEAKKQQKKNSDKDFEAKGKKGKAKDILKEKIAKALSDLQDCEKNCPSGETTTTPTPTPKEGPGDDGKQPQPPPQPNIEIPKPPECFDTQKDKDAFIEKLENEKKKWSAELAGIIKNGAGTKEDLAKAAQCRANISALDDAITNADKNVQICKKGGGTAKTPTPGKGKPKKAPRVATGGNISLPSETFCALISENKIRIEITGTGETIGPIAEVRISNLTDEPIEVTIPPAVLESRSEKNQNYAVPHTTEVALKPHEAKTIPLDGVCLDRHKPPVGKGIGDDLAFVDCDPDRHINRDDSDRMLRIAESVYEAADKLEDEGKLKEIPYKDPKKRKEIVEQWATWIRVSEVTGDPPPTKDDLKKVVEKQVGKVPPDKQKKIDEGIDAIFDKIELTTEKAKDLDRPEGETVEETPPVGQPEYVGQSGHTFAKQPTATPTPKPKGGGTKTKPTPTPKEKGPGTKEKPTPTPTATPGGDKTTEKPQEPESPTPTPTPLPRAHYPVHEKIDCGDIEIAMGTKGDLIFDFKPNGKCPCKEFGWIQHISPSEYDNWRYDNGTIAGIGSKKVGAKSHPELPKQPTQPPKGKKPNEWGEGNPWYGGTNDPKKPKDFDEHPEPQINISDTPTIANQKFITQLVCVATGEVYFSWAWGPTDGQSPPDKLGGAQIPPPPPKKK